MKRVLLTGARGFIGRQCIRPLIDQNYEIHCISSTPVDAVKSSRVSWHQVDLLDTSSVRRTVEHIRPTHLLHLAWFTKPGEYIQSPLNLEWIGASLDLAKTFAACGGQRAVFAGTCFEYDWHYGYCSERLTPLRPATLYGTCKHALREVLANYSHQAGLSAAWGRIFFVYGPHEHPARLVSSVMRSLLNEKPAHCSPGTQIRDFLHVEDVAGAMVALLESEITGSVNIASGEPVAVKDIVHTIAGHLGREELVRLGALPARPDEPRLLVADIGRLATEVGFTPRYTLETGIPDAIRWWAENLTEKMSPALVNNK